MLGRRISRRIGMLMAGVLAVASLLPFTLKGNVLAAGNYHAFNQSAPSDGCVMTLIEGTFDPASVTDILNKINEYRREACAEGVRDPRNPNRNLTMSDYVPIKWSTGLEQMAMLRAAEGSIYMDHTRPNGTSCWGASYDVTSNNEVLAWYGGLLSGIGGWYEEKYDYVNQTGGVTGHYTSMINPSNLYCGVACFNGCAAGEFTIHNNSSFDQTKIDVSQYSGQYTEIRSNLISSVSIAGDPSCAYNGGTTRYSLSSFNMSYSDYWGDTRTVTGLKYISGGTWTSSNPSVASVAPDGTVTGGAVGTATISFNCGSISLSKSISIVNGQPMYRLYNRNSGEHFYTANYAERTTLIDLGWNDEGIGWIAPFESSTPIYRLYNPYGGEHHYTASMSERDALIAAGWNYEAIGWYSDDAQTVPLYRQYNPNAYANNHNYTTSINENNSLVSIGWRAEGIGWYGIG